jgi:hypothetical protein
MPPAARTRRDPLLLLPPRWRRALSWGAVLLVLGTLATCSLGVLRGIHPPFWTLYAMGQVAVFMEFHDRGLPGPRFIAQRAPGPEQPCFRDGAPDPALAPGADCHPGLFQAEGTYTRAFIPWSDARESGLVMPAYLLHAPFGARLLAYAEAPCRAVRDFDGVVMPARPDGRGLAWLAQEMRVLREAFDCDGDGRLRAAHRDHWAEMSFRLHLYDASGRPASTLDLAPGWASPRRRSSPSDWTHRVPHFGWLPEQFPPAARLDPPAARAHSSP